MTDEIDPSSLRFNITSTCRVMCEQSVEFLKKIFSESEQEEYESHEIRKISYYCAERFLNICLCASLVIRTFNMQMQKALLQKLK